MGDSIVMRSNSFLKRESIRIRKLSVGYCIAIVIAIYVLIVYTSQFSAPGTYVYICP